MATVERYGSGYSVRYRYETETGEKKQKRVSGFHTKEEAWAAAKELKEKSDAGINVNGSAMTCAELMALWFADRHVGLAVTTKAKYSASIEVLSKTFIADLKIRQLTHKMYHLLLDKPMFRMLNRRGSPPGRPLVSHEKRTDEIPATGGRQFFSPHDRGAP